MPNWFDDVVIGLVTTAIAGAAVWGVRSFLGRRERNSVDRQHGLDDGVLVKILSDWYHGQQLDQSLYTTVAAAPGTQLPILVDTPMLFEQPVEAGSARLLEMDDQDSADDLPVNDKVIDKRRARGTQLKNNPIVYVRGRTEDVGGIVLRGRYSRYFAYVTAVDGIERDITRRRRGRFSLLSERYRDAKAAFEGNHPLWVSGNATTVFEHDNQLLVPMQMRSKNVVNGQGQFTVLPVFGIEPVDTTGLRSRFSTLFHNVAREFGEELFDVAEVQDVEAMRRGNPDWICDHEPISAFVDAEQDGRIRVTATGLAVNPRDENLAISLLIHVKCDDEWSDRLSRTSANWEGDPTAAIRFHDLRSTWLDDRIAEGKIYPTSAFSIDRARVALGVTARR